MTNLSNYELNKIELNVLKLHPKFEIMPKNIPKENFVTEVENSLFNCKNYYFKSKIIKRVNNIIETSKIPDNNLKPIEISVIKKLKNNSEIKIFKADKNAGTVILNTENYNSMLSEMLNNKIYVKTESDGTKIVKSLQTKLEILITKLIQEEKLPIEFKNKLLCNSPNQPRMYVLPKIHKKPISLRPIVTTVNSVTYKLSKFLHSVLKDIFPLPNFCVKNNSDFVEKLKNATIYHNSILFSLDVKSLFTRFPTNELKTILYQKINDVQISNCKNLLSKSDIIELLEISFLENFFY